MKLTRYLLAGMLLSMLLGSCVTEESITPESSVGSPSEFCIYTRNDGATSRTIMDGVGNVQWQATDRINVNGTVNTETDITWNEGTETRFGFATEPIAERGIYYAVYPAVATDGTSNTYQAGSGGNFNVKLPQEQPYKDGVSFSDKVNLSVASGQTNQMLFFNVCGIVQASLKTSRDNITGIKKVRFVSNAGKAVAGTGVVNAVTKNLTLNAGQSELVDVVFATPQTITSSTPLTVLWCLPVNSYEAGWKIQLLGESDHILTEEVSKEAFTVQRSKVTLVAPNDFPFINLAPTSNCYMLVSNESVNVPVGRANESFLQIGSYPMIDGKCVQLESGDAWTAEIAFQLPKDVITLSVASGIGPFGGFKVDAGATEGNAIVNIRKTDTKEILWSWHIWVTSSAVGSFQWRHPDLAPRGGSVIFMDRNLGESKEFPAGSFYQWGRKDPYFKYGSPFGRTDWQTRTYGITYTVRNPLIYIYNLAYHDWSDYTTDGSGNKDLWSGDSISVMTRASKSIYDPCPTGWRVPSWINGVSPFAGMTKDNAIFDAEKGVIWGGNLFPFGTIVDGLAGEGGGCWTTSVAPPIGASPSAYCFSMEVWLQWPDKILKNVSNLTTYRINRLQVRCEKE